MTSALRLILLLFAALTLSGEASGKSPGEFDRHVAEARRFYTETNYTKAIEEFEAAYKLDPDPELLISIGRCLYLADRPREALTYYDQALKQKLTRLEREELAASVNKATIKLLAQDRVATQEQRAKDQAQLAALSKSIATSAPPEKKPFYKSGWFWGTIGGVTGAGLAIGLGLGLGLHKDVMPVQMGPGPGDNIFPLRSN